MTTPRDPVDDVLIAFGPNDVTVRAVQAIMTVLPDVRPPPMYRSLAEAATMLHLGAPDGLVDRARELASGADAALAAKIARSLDQGDRGIPIFTGLSTAMGLFFGNKKGLQGDPQQRSDAAVKALGLAAIVHLAVPGSPADKVRIFAHLPSGKALLHYWGMVEVALPFVDAVVAAEGAFVEQLLQAEIAGAIPRIVPVTGREGAAAAQAQLPFVGKALEAIARDGVSHVGPLAEALRTYLPGVLATAGENLPELVATGADTLPVYDYLVPRVIAEACLARARMELDPSWEAAPPAPPEPLEMDATTGEPIAAPLADVPGTSAPNANPFARPLTDAPPGAGAPDANPFATPLTSSATGAPDASPFASPLTAPGATPVAPAADANPFASPLTAPGATPVAPVADANPFASPLTAPGAGGAAATVGANAAASAASAASPAPPGAGSAPRGPDPRAVMPFADPPAAAAAPPPPVPLRAPEPPRAAAPVSAAAPSAGSADAEADWDPVEPLSGSFLHAAGGLDLWLVFAKDGRFTTAPPVKPPPIDWDAHARAGNEVGRYRRNQGRLILRWDDDREDTAAIEVADYAIVVDGRECRRADWDLTGCALAGTWRPRGERSGGYSFAADGRFAEADAPNHGGTYVLGRSRVELCWDEGGDEHLSLLTDLQPSAESPDVLFLVGQPFERVR